MNTQRLVFLADDDPDDRELFREAMEIVQPGIICITASDGEDALRQMQAETFALPDLIFIDVNMPRISGRELLLAIKEMKKFGSIPVIMYSTASLPQEKERMLREGAAQYLLKAVSFDDLCNQLRDTLVRYEVY